MSNWQMVRMDQCCEVVSGATPKTNVEQYWGGNIHWATPADLGKLDGPWITDTPRTLTESGLSSCGASVLPVGSVLFSSRAPIGHVAINTIPMATNQGFKSFVPRKDVLDSSYLYYWLRAHRLYLESLGTGATFKEVSKVVVSKIEIPLPPLTVQRRIAEILDQAREMQAKRRQTIVLIDKLAQSIFLDMFGGLSRFETVSVDDLATNIRTGPFGSDLLHSEFVDDGIAVLGIDNAVNNEFTWSQRRFITIEKYQKLVRYRVYAGDLLITIMGTCGRCAIVPDDIPVAINTKHLCCITLDKSRCLPEFLHAYFLMHPIARRYLEQTAKGAIMSGLNATIIKSLPVQLPPFADQERFAKTSLQLREQKSRFSGQAQEFDELFKSLQQRAFRNEL